MKLNEVDLLKNPNKYYQKQIYKSGPKKPLCFPIKYKLPFSAAIFFVPVFLFWHG